MSLIKIASAMTKRIMDGAISAKGLKALALSGTMRSKETMLNGFKKGTQNLLKKHQITVKSMKGASFDEIKNTANAGGYMAIPHLKQINVHGNSFIDRLASPASSIFKPKGTGSDSVALRHEFDEIMEAGKSKNLGIIKNSTNKKRDGLVGSHETLGVLHKERRNTRLLNAHGVETKHINKHREKTNEYAALGNATKLSDVRKLKPNSEIKIDTAFGRAKLPAFDVTK